jgi:hypothetical protein
MVSFSLKEINSLIDYQRFYSLTDCSLLYSSYFEIWDLRYEIVINFPSPHSGKMITLP